MSLKEISLEELLINPMTLIGNEWMLVTAGTEANGINTMTAAWGHLGTIWNKPTACIYVRPQRFTREFVDREEYFSLTFFEDSWKKQLRYLGTVSGRDENKIEKAGLTPVHGEGATWFAEGKLVLICRKLFRQELPEDSFLDKQILDRNYPERDMHIMYIGEIVKILIEE